MGDLEVFFCREYGKGQYVGQLQTWAAWKVCRLL